MYKFTYICIIRALSDDFRYFLAFPFQSRVLDVNCNEAVVPKLDIIMKCVASIVISYCYKIMLKFARIVIIN